MHGKNTRFAMVFFLQTPEIIGDILEQKIHADHPEKRSIRRAHRLANRQAPPLVAGVLVGRGPNDSRMIFCKPEPDSFPRIEGLRLGNAITALPPASRMNLETRIAKADSYFNRYIIHRCGIVDDRILAFVERIRDRQILTQSGDLVKANIRRLEIIELTQAVDDWQMNQTRHVYRQYEPLEKSPAFCRHTYLPALSGIRVVTTLKELGTIAVPKD